MGRLFEILYYLLEVKETTAQQLAQHFEVSVRTIYRDLNRLLVAGIPIVSKQGVNGGVMIDKNYIFDKSVLNENQQEKILLALQTLSALNIQEFQDVSQILELMFNKKTSQWLDIDFTTWHSSKKIDNHFHIIKEALFTHHFLTFQYINNQGIKSQKTVEPLQLLFKQQSWYMQGYDCHKQSIRVYKLTRMHHLEKSQATFLPRQLPITTPVYQHSYPMRDVLLKFDLTCGSFVYDEFDEQDIIKQDDYYLIKTRIPNHQEFLSFLLSFGSHVQIIEPLSLQLEYLKEIEKIRKIYDKT